MLLGVHRGVESVDLRIEKPGALEGRARAASVQIRRKRRDYPVSVAVAEHGQREVLLETREARLELVHIEPQRGIVTGPEYPAQGYPAECLEWVVAGELETEHGRLEPSLPAGVIHSSSDAPSRFRNPGPASASLFRCWKRTP